MILHLERIFTSYVPKTRVQVPLPAWEHSSAYKYIFGWGRMGICFIIFQVQYRSSADYLPFYFSDTERQIPSMEVAFKDKIICAFGAYCIQFTH